MIKSDADEFDFEDDDFLAETFLNIPETELTSTSVHENCFSQNEDIVKVGPKKSSTLLVDDAKKNLDFNDVGEELFSDASSIFSSTPLQSKDVKKTLSFNESKVSNHQSSNSMKNSNALCSEKNENDLKILGENINKNVSVSNQPELKSAYFNSRFTPGFTPKAKKRKFPGPAGLLPETQEEISSKPLNFDKDQNLKKIAIYDVDYQDIASSQLSSQPLQFASWKKLQADVSSCPFILSTAKHFSIRRILHESSKKKLPKHVVVPILCVLIKKLNYKKPSFKSILMDDTGEISGKFDKDIIEKYGEHIIEGSAIILKKVTSLCNVLILKCESLVSIYHVDGSVKSIQSLDSALDETETVKSINSESFDSPMKSSSSFSSSKIAVCDIHETESFKPIHNESKKSSNKANFFNSSKIVVCDEQCGSSEKTSDVGNQMDVSLREKHGNHFNSVSSASKSEDLDIENEMDDFDELLGNLDETSFLNV